MEQFIASNPGYDMTSLIDTATVLNFVPRWPVFINLITACLCLGLSATYHNFFYQNRYLMDKLATLDFGGICLLIMGSTYPPIFYPFACESTHEMRNVCLVVITIFCVGAFMLLLNKKVASSECRGFRSAMFISLGVSCVLPLAYLSFAKDPVNVSYFSIAPYGLGGAFYIGGAILYGSRTPERFFPGKLNLVGSSH